MSKKTPPESKVKPLRKYHTPDVKVSVFDTPVRQFSGATADWDSFIRIPANIGNLRHVASVPFFKHAPLADIWDTLTSRIDDIVFEIPNIYAQPFSHGRINWWAKIFLFAGYKCLIEYENFGAEERIFAWTTFCSDIPKPIGYSTKHRILMYPTINTKDCNIPDYYKIAYNRVKGKPTVEENHGQIITDAIKRKRTYNIGNSVEVIDLELLCSARVGIVKGWIGDRMTIRFDDNEQTMAGAKSDIVHPLGWCNAVGHELCNSSLTAELSLDKSYFKDYNKNNNNTTNIKLKVDQYLEIRHPSMPYKIIGARIREILRYGYFYAEFPSLLLLNRGHTYSKFAFHITSPYIFPCGFCEKHGIELLPPYEDNDGRKCTNNSNGSFKWKPFFKLYNNCLPAPLNLLPKRAENPFEIGMKLEAVDELSPTHLGPATIIRKHAHLLKIHFDGWKTSKLIQAEHWVDFESPNLYPVGYCELVGHTFSSRVETVAEALAHES